MAGNFEYYAELGLNAGSAINELSRVASTANTVTKNLDGMNKALDQVSKKGLRQGDEKQLRDTLGLYQQLAGAVQAYGKSLQTINSTDLNNGVRKTTTSLQHMHKALSDMGTVDSAKVKGLKDTLGLYKQLADASAKYASTMKLEADAIRAVASAEKTRAQTAASAANAATRGTGGADMWGVTADEREQRRKAQVVMQAEREMNAEFERRAQVQMKARAEMEKTAQAEVAKATATEKAAAATTKASASEEDQQRALASTRYALYEVAAAYTATAAAAMALPAASARAAIEMEAQFAHVARTTQLTGQPLAELREGFVDLSTQIPVTFEDLAKIGTLGAQMGIAARDLDEFTEVVAKFSATTNATVDQAATYFGRIANMMSDLDSSNFENFGAAVSEMGTASVATETEILAVAESIATTANMAGFSTHELVGLSTAMASLRIRPEMARGAMQRVFAKINVAVGEGTEQLSMYAQMLGMTEQAAADLWRNDPSEFFYGINAALSNMNDNIERSAFIRDGLGITNVRDVELLSRLSNGLEVYADSMNLAQDAYARGDYLDKESGVIFETTAASLQRLASAFKAMLDSFGQSSLAPIRLVTELLIGLMNHIREMHPATKSALSTISLLVGGFAAFRAAIALTTASMLAFQMIQKQLAPEGRVTFATLLNQAGRTFPGMKAQIDAASLSLVNFRNQLVAAQGVMGKAAVAANGLGAALKGLGAAGWIGILLTGAATVWGIAQAHESAAKKAREHASAFIETAGGMESLMEALRQDAEAFASGEQTEVLGRLKVRMEEVEPAARTAADALTGTLIPAHEKQAEAVKNTTDAYIEGIGAIGEYTDRWMREGLAKALSEEFSGEEMTRIIESGFDLNEMTRIWQRQGAQAAQDYAQTFATSLRNDYRDDFFAAMPDNFIDPEHERALQGLFDRLGSQFVDMNSGLDGIRSQMIAANELGVSAFEGIEEGAEGAADKVETLNDELSDLLDSMFRIVDAEAAVFAAMEAFGAGLDENGLDFNTWTEAGRSNLENFRNVLDAMLSDIVAQVEQGLLSADDAAILFGQQYEAFIAHLESLGVDPAQFDYFYDHIDTLFATPIAVQVDVAPAFEELNALSQHAYNVLSSIAAQSSGIRGGLASWGAGVVDRVRTRQGANPVTINRPKNYLGGAAGTSGARAAQFQALEASRARAEQERLAKAAEQAAKETERQAKEQKRAADEAKKLRDEIADAKDEGRIFEEIIKGLGQAFKDTLHQFNNFQASRDSVEQQLHNMRNAAQDAADKVRDLREEHAKLMREAAEEHTDARQAESFAAVARQYGDTERFLDYSQQADEARASAREKERLARQAANEADALDKNRLALTGYSEQAIKNRGDVRALQQQMTDLILAYAETGATTEEVTAYAEQLRRKFVDQLVQMGYNRQDAERLSRVFVQLKEDIDRVPRDVRIQAHARVKEAEEALRNVARGRTATIEVVPKNDNFTLNGNLLANDFIVGRQVKSPSLEVGRVTDYGNGITSNWARRGGGLIPGPSNPRGRDNMLVVGPNGPEGTVGSGEFVIRKPAVDAIGLNALHAINSMSPGAAVMSSAPAVNASRGIQLVELLPHQVHQLAQAVSTVLAVDGKVLAGTTNAQNTNAARRGVR